MADSAPICPQCGSPLKLYEAKTPRGGGKSASGGPVLASQKQWICTGEDCMYTANGHVYAQSR
jgi:hypothetical protein